MSEEFYPEHEIHTDPVENQQTEQQTWQAAQQQAAPEGNAAGSKPADDDVVDADFTDVKK